MPPEMPQSGYQESHEQTERMSWEELIQLAHQGKCSETEMDALKMQAQMRLEHLKNTLPEGSAVPTLTEFSFEIDFSKKQVLKAELLGK